MTATPPPPPPSSPAPPGGHRSRLPLIIGVMAVAGGLWLLLNALGLGIPPFKDVWPVLLILAGGACVAHFLAFSRNPTSVGWAVALIGFGILFLTLTFEVTGWRQILDWLPSLPTILGLAWLGTWLAADRQPTNYFVAGTVFLCLGLVGFGARFDVLRRVLPSAQVLWALMFLGVGGYLVWRTVRSR